MYKHWQKKHSGTVADSPAAKLEQRWRVALKNKTITAEALDAAHPLALEGSEALRSPVPIGSTADDFGYDFELHTDAHRSWLMAAGSL